MSKRLYALFCLLVIITSGCASNWAVESQPARGELLWPPEKPKIRYDRTITGFREIGTSLKDLVSGKDSSRIMQPVAVAEGRDGRFAIADMACKCVHVYIPQEQKYIMVSTAEGEEMVSPVSAIFDDDLRLYVSDSSRGRIFVFDSGGGHLFSISRAGGISLKRPTGLAYNSDMKVIYAVDTLSHKVFCFSTKGEYLFSFGERGSGDGQFNFPTHIVSSPDRLVYVTDSMNFRVQVFDVYGDFIAAFGHHGDGSGDFAMPKGVAVDSKGAIYVVDSLFDSIQLFDHQGEFLLTLGSRGTGQGEFWLPTGIFIGNSDNLYVCDTYNQRIQVFRIMENPQ